MVTDERDDIPEDTKVTGVEVIIATVVEASDIMRPQRKAQQHEA